MFVDTYGRPYALVSEVVEGSVVIVDHDFDCMRPWSEKVVKIDDMKVKNWGYDGSLQDCIDFGVCLDIRFGIHLYRFLTIRGDIIARS